MKKFFTLIAAALMAVGVNAAKTSIPITGWGWGWSSEVTSADGNMVISITGNNGAGSTGWSDGADWSNYTSISAVVENCTIPEGGYGQMQVKYNDGTEDKYLSGGITSSAEQQVVTIKFDDPSVLTNVKQLWIQGSEGSTFTVSSVYLENDEAEPTQVAIDLSKISAVTKNEDGTYTYTSAKAWGWDNIWYGDFNASDYDFIGIELAEAATVNFQVVVQYDDGENGKNVEVAVIAGETSGTLDLDATLKSSIKQIALQASDAGTVKIKSVYWGKKTSTGISTVKANGATSGNDVYYNLSGQRVAKPSKGLFIHNGKKVILK